MSLFTVTAAGEVDKAERRKKMEAKCEKGRWQVADGASACVNGVWLMV